MSYRIKRFFRILYLTICCKKTDLYFCQVMDHHFDMKWYHDNDPGDTLYQAYVYHVKRIPKWVTEHYDLWDPRS